jgi:hypothetical protein
MTQHKKAPSGGSAHVALKRSAQVRKAIEQAIGKAPKLHADHHEAQMRNHLRMRTSAK